MTTDNGNLKELSTENTFLPNFCEGKSVFVLVLVAQLFVLAMVLASSGIREFAWNYLALVSLLVQWVVLVSALCLCKLRNNLAKLSLLQTVFIVYLLILAVTVVATLIADWVLLGADFKVLVIPFDGYGLLRNLLVSAIMTGMVLRYLYVQARLRRQEQAELQSRIQALQSRIRPHFLFNSMNIIASLIASDPDTAEQVVEDLSELFRASLKGADRPVKLSHEIELCKRYVGIEKLRLGERLQVDWKIESLPEHLTIPLLTLQPLLENSIYHGIQPLTEGGIIGVVIGYQVGWVKIIVSNPYTEMKRSVQGHGNQIALNNIRSRISACYGEDAELKTYCSEGVFVTQISYPLAQPARGLS